MADLESTIVDAIDATPEQKATPHELRARVNDMGIDTSADEIEAACDDLVRAGELEVVGEREDSKLYERIDGTEDGH